MGSNSFELSQCFNTLKELTSFKCPTGSSAHKIEAKGRAVNDKEPFAASEKATIRVGGQHWASEPPMILEESKLGYVARIQPVYSQANRLITCFYCITRKRTRRVVAFTLRSAPNFILGVVDELNSSSLVGHIAERRMTFVETTCSFSNISLATFTS